MHPGHNVCKWDDGVFRSCDPATFYKTSNQLDAPTPCTSVSTNGSHLKSILIIINDLETLSPEWVKKKSLKALLHVGCCHAWGSDWDRRPAKLVAYLCVPHTTAQCFRSFLIHSFFLGVVSLFLYFCAHIHVCQTETPACSTANHGVRIGPFPTSDITRQFVLPQASPCKVHKRSVVFIFVVLRPCSEALQPVFSTRVSFRISPSTCFTVKRFTMAKENTHYARTRRWCYLWSH